ncbi:glycosyltransferase [Pleurocapsales cyanobacterium LEGE 10410]|nr:glycosyltransferase [Pleurocapsales cyanobacterium LEGE 10410]
MTQKLGTQANSLELNTKALPIVSVITVVFNGKEYLEQTIQSIAEQTYKNIEYIIIDGGSTDGTIEIIKQYEDKIVTRWLSEGDRGLYDAMNKGIALAKGELIGILNSDDLYFPNTVAEVVKEYRKIRQPCVIYGDMVRFAEEGQTESLFRGDLSERAFEKAKIIINHPTCFVHRSLYEKFGGFNLEYEVGADRELMLRFYRHGTTFIKLDQTLAKFRLGGTTSDQSLPNIFQREVIQEYKLLNAHAIARATIFSCLAGKTIKSLRKWLFYRVFGDKIASKIIMSYVSKKFPHRPHTNS